jgi:hypothetical protein
VLYAVLAGGQSWQGYLARLRNGVTSPAAWSSEGIVTVASVLLAGGGLALLPWPLHPVPLDRTAWLWAWAALEAAFLLPLLPGLFAGAPVVVRAAIRAAQIGVLSRALLWLALAVGLLLHTEWQVFAANGHSPLIAHLLALIAATFAFPGAIGWGPFAPETSIASDGVNQGLSRAMIDFAQAAHTVRMAALLAASLVALLPLALLPAWAGVLLVLATFCGVCWLLQWQTGRYPRLTLPDALRLCMWRALPPGLAAVIYMGLLFQSIRP